MYYLYQMNKVYKFCLFSVIILSGTLLMGQRSVGTNLSAIKDYSSQFVFKDAFKASRGWIPFNLDGSGGWDSGVSVPLQSNGYPLEIPYDNGVDQPQGLRSLVLWDLDYGYPGGSYTLHLEGTGTVKLIFGASGTFSSPGTYTFTPNGGNFGIEILASDVNNPIDKIEIVLPGYAANYQAAPFHPDFLTFIDDFEVLRFMDLMETNFSPIVSWSDRTSEDYYSQATSYGLAYEYIVQLANLTNKDIWVCIPHQADDNYISQLAVFLQTHLNSNLKIYLEYSNEVWNGTFAQNSYAAQQGQNLGFTGQPWERTWKYYAKRTADVFYLFEQIYGANSPKLVKVIGSQAVNSWLSGTIIDYFNDVTYNPNGVTANCLAIAPYFGGEVADNIGNAGEIDTISVDEILNRVEASLPGVEANIIAQKTTADSKGLQLITYEGGQHIVANAYQNNNTLTQKLNAANRNARMESIYCTYLDSWYQNVPTGLFMNFTSISSFSKYGSWGIKEYTGQPSSEAPKYRAFENCVFNTALAVDLSTFHVIIDRQENVVASWTSEAEKNLAHYELERSADGRRFSAIGRVAPNSQHLYHFVDTDPLPGNNYYRLKMVDKDETFTYSKVQSVFFKDWKELISLSPNPFTTQIKINYTSLSKGTINVLDVHGRIVFSKDNNPEYLYLDNLKAGVYYIQYTTARRNQVLKAIKVR